VQKHMIDLNLGAVQNHRSQSHAEERQRDIATALRRILLGAQERWIEVLPTVVLGLNCAASSIRGVSTFEIFYARQPRTSVTFNLPENVLASEAERSLIKRAEMHHLSLKNLKKCACSITLKWTDFSKPTCSQKLLRLENGCFFSVTSHHAIK